MHFQCVVAQCHRGDKFVLGNQYTLCYVRVDRRRASLCALPHLKYKPAQTRYKDCGVSLLTVTKAFHLLFTD
jgi:hypothetical protein